MIFSLIKCVGTGEDCAFNWNVEETISIPREQSINQSVKAIRIPERWRGALNFRFPSRSFDDPSRGCVVFIKVPLTVGPTEGARRTEGTIGKRRYPATTRLKKFSRRDGSFFAEAVASRPSTSDITHLRRANDQLEFVTRRVYRSEFARRNFSIVILDQFSPNPFFQLS